MSQQDSNDSNTSADRMSFASVVAGKKGVSKDAHTLPPGASNKLMPPSGTEREIRQSTGALQGQKYQGQYLPVCQPQTPSGASL